MMDGEFNFFLVPKTCIAMIVNFLDLADYQKPKYLKEDRQLKMHKSILICYTGARINEIVGLKAKVLRLKDTAPISRQGIHSNQYNDQRPWPRWILYYRPQYLLYKALVDN